MITGPDPPVVIIGISIFVMISIVIGGIALYHDDTEYEVEKKDGTIIINVDHTKENGGYTIIVFKDKTEIRIQIVDIKEIRAV